MNEEQIRDKEGFTEAEFLQKYDASIYERPSVTVDMLIFTVVDEEKENYRRLPEKSLKLLLVKRGVHPYMGQWALPGGFVTGQESLEEAAMRELKSETNIDEVYLEQLYTWGDVNRDPRTRVISCSYMALADSTSLEVRAGDDAADAKWFNVTYRVLEEKKTMAENSVVFEKVVQLTLANEEASLGASIRLIEQYTGRSVKEERIVTASDGIAFDHAEMIQYAIERLRNKIEYTDIAFHLMPELFTLSELQQVYEVMLGKELLSAAFRRKIADMVVETNQLTKDAGHRPAKLFRFNPNWRRR
ncbi:NUDIX domain-containing protein [Paenibacillus sp. GCM10023248]|uniref:NUDIX hydrolase n=1 Tax=Bacillales TaxID=1385 RepID=UPI0023790CC2|nr:MULTISPECIES: NUDIX domain-containing protein [Bacillales]MDD9268225.1 NUDIX domain-containing protein [Paenibacillus sp. MAHUQ-63]MDR6879902.1 ADP-ribose pyrophosphatase YjhB (NUDIX family) [Bacillus sp. 3255]